MADKAYRMLTKGGTKGAKSGKQRSWREGQVLVVPEGEFKHLAAGSYEVAEKSKDDDVENAAGKASKARKKSGK